MNVPWTEARVTQMIMLWNKMHSATEIASMLGGTTRQAVTSKVSRLREAGDPRITRFVDPSQARHGTPRNVGDHVALAEAKQKELDNRSLYILQRHENDKADFSDIASELAEKRDTVLKHYNAIIRDLEASEAA